MEMNDILKWGLVAGAAWFLIDHFQKQQAQIANGGHLPAPGEQPANGQPAGNGNGQPAGNGQQAANGNGQPAETLRDRLVAAAGVTSGLNWDQWNYYLNQLTGSFAAEPGGFDRSLPAYQSMTVDAFLSAGGLGGLKGLAPLYRALNRGNEWFV